MDIFRISAVLSLRRGFPSLSFGLVCLTDCSPNTWGSSPPAVSPRCINPIEQVFARRKHFLRKSRKPYTDPGPDYQEIMARKNAPRWIRMMKDCGIKQPAAGPAVTGRGVPDGRKVSCQITAYSRSYLSSFVS